MRRHCDGTDPNLIAADGSSPCACGLQFDDVEWAVVYPHTKIRKARFVFGPGEAWFWPHPADGGLVPDYPPTRLDHEGVTLIVDDPPDDHETKDGRQ